MIANYKELKRKYKVRQETNAKNIKSDKLIPYSKAPGMVTRENAVFEFYFEYQFEI